MSDTSTQDKTEQTALPEHLLFQIHFPPDSISTIGLPIKDEIVIGRTDEVENFYPDIDLIPFGALENGVSRHHARIIQRDNWLYLRDENSKNGTHLNDSKLETDEIYRLSDGDVILFGQLSVMLRFVSQES